MDKIIKVINKMIDKKDLIKDAREGSGFSDNEIFFKYKEYIWGITSLTTSNYNLYYYPDQTDVKELADAMRYDNTDIKFVTHSTSSYDSPEAIQSFKELHSTVKSKLYNMDETLDDILNDD
ncbi:hypothetical protein BALOs_0728 [Halobacteriovorax sp. BALOs_7]|uniref:hypothetical protein n=1 Tax=Halobacteriovorax sp. BALOs_7 TaxID=2109558 RepID=UPI000EA3042E|nr:hypothetical protein [Halobacteriovorax sp. BALOs_7]AYF43738.1 hypothetical protein BALOs_0728 [Halobacteriovorax sp. BALOs_7]